MSRFGPSAAMSRSPVASALMRERFRSSRHIPWTVRAAFWAAIVGPTMTVLFVAVRVVTTNWDHYVSSRVHSFVHNGHRLEVTPAIVISTIGFGMAVALIGAAVRIVLAVQFLRGFGWARLVASVLAAAGLVVLVWDPAAGVAGVGAADAVLDDLAAVAVAVGVVLLWLPSGNRYFQAMKGDRRCFRATQLQ